jgi:MFS family permease
MNTINLSDRALPAEPHRALGFEDYKTLSLAALGGALDFYDFIIFVFFAPVIGQLFFPPGVPDWLRQLQTFGIFAAGYLARPVGGIVLAHFGDLTGRKRMFMLSVLMMSVPTLLMGLAPTYANWGVMAPGLLLVLRILQGAAVGGEVPGAWVFVSEHVPRRHIGFACGILTAGLTGGILLGSLISAAIHSRYSHDEVSAYAWRIPFLIGGVFGIISVYLRRWLQETPVFAELKLTRSLAAEIPLKAVLRDHAAAVAVSVVLTWMLSADIVVVILMTPQLLQKQAHLSAETVFIASCAATLCLSFGCVLAGWFAGRFGSRKTIFISQIALAVCYYATFHASVAHSASLITLYAVTGFTVGGVAVVPLVMVRMFPAAVRISGISFSYNLSYAVFGGLTPIAVALLMKWNLLAPVAYVAVLGLIGIITIPFIKDGPRVTATASDS